jgi:hypothetical protein
MREAGVDFFVGYLGVLNAERLGHLMCAGIAFMPVTLASQYNGTASVNEAQALGLPAGTTVWLDLEGLAAFKAQPQELAAKINAWAATVQAAGYEPGLYVGSPQPFTSQELYALGVVRYWRAPSRVMDRNGKLADPSCGWCMSQLWPSVTWAGVWSDINFVQQDYRGRLPTWAVAV